MQQDFNLSEEEKKLLLEISRETLNNYIISRIRYNPELKKLTYNLTQNCGAFVTLYKDGKLRGCIGRFGDDTPLWKIVREMTISSATQDSRFMPVIEKDLKDINIEISVLTPLKKISTLDDLEIGKHGIYIKHGFSSGTFLPQVATEQGWDKEEFVGRCSRDKVGIGYSGWKNAELFVYESIIVKENK